jgi:NADPH-ferrihemoprotein reductase
MVYETGDYLGIIPQNFPRLVERIGQRLDLDLDSPIDTTNTPSLLAARSCTVTAREALISYLDLSDPPRRTTLRSLADYADGVEREKLLFLGSRSELGIQDYNEWVVGNRMGLLDILDVFPSIKHIPVSEIASVLTPLQARYYSIASSAVISPHEIHIAAAIVRYLTPNGKTHHGVCTSFLKHRNVGDTVPCFVKQSLFRLPNDPTIPIIMFSAGSGVAPFRAFTAERIYTQQNMSESERGDNVLFFGFGRRDEDFLYGDQFNQYVEQGNLKLFPAAGFDQPWHNFIQHRMLEPSASALIWDLVKNKNAWLFVCGDSIKMAPGVHEALLEVFAREGNLSKADAEQMLLDMKQRNVYQLDVF